MRAGLGDHRYAAARASVVRFTTEAATARASSGSRRSTSSRRCTSSHTTHIRRSSCSTARAIPRGFVAGDDTNDVAILELDGEAPEVPLLLLGDPASLAIGSLVIAIGHPLATKSRDPREAGLFVWSMTHGVLSARNDRQFDLLSLWLSLWRTREARPASVPLPPSGGELPLQLGDARLGLRSRGGLGLHRDDRGFACAGFGEAAFLVGLDEVGPFRVAREPEAHRVRSVDRSHEQREPEGHARRPVVGDHALDEIVLETIPDAEALAGGASTWNVTSSRTPSAR